MSKHASCPTGERRSLPTGIQVIYRQKRKKRRVYSPSDMSRIARYAACDHAPMDILCATAEGLGLDVLVKERIEAGRASLVETRTDVDPNTVRELEKVLESMEKAVQRSGWIRWVLRRVAPLAGLLAALELARRVMGAYVRVDENAEECLDVLGLFSCEGV